MKKQTEEELKKQLEEVEKQKDEDCVKEVNEVLAKYGRGLSFVVQGILGRPLEGKLIIVRK